MPCRSRGWHGFARMATSNNLEPLRARKPRAGAVRCLHGRALLCRRHRPAHLHEADAAGVGRIFAKTGAEGVFCAAIPDQGISIAVKCDDGHARRESMVAAACALSSTRTAPSASVSTDLATSSMHNWNGDIHVGDIRAAAVLSD